MKCKYAGLLGSHLGDYPIISNKHRTASFLRLHGSNNNHHSQFSDEHCMVRVQWLFWPDLGHHRK